jgi:hypothetical protein
MFYNNNNNNDVSNIPLLTHYRKNIQALRLRVKCQIN